MAYFELDTTISAELTAMKKEISKFARKVMRPAGIELDKLADPADVYAKGSVLWDVMKTFRKMHLHALGIPKELGGLAGDTSDPKASGVLFEEIGYGDAGLAISLGGSNPFRLAAASPDPKLQQIARDYVNDMDCNLIGCWAITEPSRGSDWISGVRDSFDNPDCAPELRAELKGGEYILNGQKAAWVSNATIASHATVHVSIDPSKGMQGNGLAVVPLDLPGVRKGKPLDKVGQRPLNQGELFFEEVKIPKSFMVIDDPKKMQVAIKSIFTNANAGMGQVFVGLAQAAFDEALSYAKQRVQGGVPIFEHKNIKLQLFEMFTKVEAARAYARRMAAYNTLNPPGSLHHAIAAKVFSTRTAFEVASEALTIFGGNGLTREYPIEKMFRDAKASMIEDGENNVLSLMGSEDL
ncbi:MAG: acyl-CoA/acyl-ACP dehydrogenase [Deltaproteobacteria bacterium]|jgi:alkylation response protein AidB-like acyl-CoA dehydrogenase|nr:acyl-CoA/acyl-ACP dehydrogenase [Deltaproteobacteria bacterium]MBT4639744.1 acyl-CoA/acyl-ACP dehydrogenase [Deltaproteobacteria bacterium]MBT6504960.1 acyl-CoA/acyl-ACP dehydrogenase [Deltaproteobacteria bacterium]